MHVCSPQLTWRDMQHIVVMTARMVNLRADDWVVNGIGRKGAHLTDMADFLTHNNLSVICNALEPSSHH